MVFAGDARPGHLPQRHLGVGEGLRRLPGLDFGAARERLDPVAVERADGAVGDQEPAALQRPPAAVDQAATDQHRVLAAGGGRPEELGAGREVGQAAQHRQGAAEDVAVPHRHHRVGELLVERQAHVEEARDVLGRARQRPVGVGDAAPGLGGVDLEPDDGVAAERLADPRREHAAPAERDRAAVVGVLQQRADDLGLARAEALLAVLLEGRRDGRAEALFHQRVDLDRRQPLGAGGLQRGRLPGPHEADEDDRRLHRSAVLTARRSAPCRRRSRRARRRCGRRRTSPGRRAPGSGRSSPRRRSRRPGRRSSRSARAAPGRAGG